MRNSQTPEVVVVTGAAAGVGRAVARAFGERGAYVGLIARGGDGMDGLAGARKDVEEAGGKALVLPIDVAYADQVEAAASLVENTFGPIDIWVNNAMVSVFSPVKEMTAEEFRRVTEVSYLGYVNGTLAALRRMLPRDHGKIIQIGSALAYRGIPLQAAYCGAKHAIQGFTESLRSELIHDKSQVKISMVQLPAVNTPQFEWSRNRLPNKAQPVPPIYQPEVIARAVTWIADHYRRELYIGMPTVITLLGNKFFAGFGDWYLAKVGYSSQQTSTPEEADRPDNLWNALPGDRGAHGPFDKRAHAHSIQLWLDTHRGVLSLVGVGAAGLIFSIFRKYR